MEHGSVKIAVINRGYALHNRAEFPAFYLEPVTIHTEPTLDMELGKTAESAFIGGMNEEEFIAKTRLLYHKVNCTADYSDELLVAELVSITLWCEFNFPLMKRLMIFSLFRWYLKLELPIEL